MEDNILKIEIVNNKVTCTTKKPIDLPTFFQVLFTAMLTAMNSVVDAQTSEDKKQCTEDVYDLFNIGASNTLDFFAPEIELRPNLTTQAILKAENEIIEEAYQTKTKQKTKKEKTKKEKN